MPSTFILICWDNFDFVLYIRNGKYVVQDQSRSLSRVFQQNYLAFAEFLPNEGLEMLISDVKAAVEEVLARYAPYLT